MAQSPANLQEPSMEELLASIREIIEENSAVAEAGELSPVHAQESDVLPLDDGKDPSQAMQEESLGAAAVPIHDAMKALAARIGLKKQAHSGEAASAQSKDEAPSLPSFPLHPSANMQIQPVSMPPPAPSSSPPAVAPMQPSPVPLSLSLQASTKPTVSPKPQSLKKQAVPLAKSIKTPQPINLSQTPIKEPLPVGHIPLYPQFRASVPRQQAGTASAAVPSSATSPVNESKSDVVEQKPEKKRGFNALEQGFVAEFEQSAELLLRPYIAAWLEEHFQHLFEKILREEIQRLMQKNLQRHSGIG